MKTKFSFISIFAILFICFNVFTISCKKDEVSDFVTYKGKVVYKGTSTPFADLEVKLTDGTNVSAASKTDEKGSFSIQVDLAKINGNYYFLVGDATCIPQKVEIPGFGEKECDLGVIEVEGPNLPVVRTKPMKDVTAESAIGGGFVDEDGRLEVIARGICYSRSEYPTIEDAHTQDGAGKGEFNSTLKNLEHNVAYYVRAYATNKKGTSYGEQVKFSTELGMAVVTTSQISDIAAESAIGGGEISSTGGFAITERGICWATHQYPSTTDSKQADGATGLGKYIVALSNLSPSTTYYVRAYATNTNGTAYGEQREFTTTSGLPEISTSVPTNIQATQATCGGNITSNGGFTITSCGVCWSTTSSNPTITESKIESVVKSGTFSVDIKPLNANTTYYVRAYATNKMGTTYGKTIEITTTSGLPTLATSTPTDIRSTQATCGGDITSNGGFTLTSCGVCWSSSSASPTINDTKMETVAKTGAFTVTITSLSAKTTYYVRAYAQNEMGISYGDTKTFTTADGLPIVSTSDFKESITSTSITTGGNVVDDGGFTITSRGVVYSTLPYPTLENASKVECGSGTGYFSANITNVSPASNTYYIRAYATNVNGTAYGDQVVITPENYEYIQLPTIPYGGYTYKIKDLGIMTYPSAVQICTQMNLGGYSDWYIPTKEELIGFMMYMNGKTEVRYQSTKYKSSYAQSLQLFGYSEIMCTDYLPNWPKEDNDYYGRISDPQTGTWDHTTSGIQYYNFWVRWEWAPFTSSRTAGAIAVRKY